MPGLLTIVADRNRRWATCKGAAAFKKVNEVDSDVDWNALPQKMQPTMQNCPMVQMMK
jgi:hypothetical protein